PPLGAARGGRRERRTPERDRAPDRRPDPAQGPRRRGAPGHAMSGRLRAAALLLAGLALYAALAVTSLRTWSATFDEGAHLPAGYTYLTQGDHRLNPEQPPLVKLLAGAALLPLRPAFKTDDTAWAAASQWELGRRFLYRWNDAGRLLFWGRLPVV